MPSNIPYKLSAGLISSIFYVSGYSGLGYHDQVILASHLVPLMCDLYRLRRCIALYLRLSLQNHVEQENEMKKML